MSAWLWLKAPEVASTVWQRKEFRPGRVVMRKEVRAAREGRDRINPLS